jgi:hypothetical protein
MDQELNGRKCTMNSFCSHFIYNVCVFLCNAFQVLLNTLLTYSASGKSLST